MPWQHKLTSPVASSPVLSETVEHPEVSFFFFLQIQILTPLRILDKHFRKKEIPYTRLSKSRTENRKRNSAWIKSNQNWSVGPWLKHLRKGACSRLAGSRSGTNLPCCVIVRTALQFSPALRLQRLNHTLELTLHACESEITLRITGIRLLEAYRIRPFLEKLQCLPLLQVRGKD